MAQVAGTVGSLSGGKSAPPVYFQPHEDYKVALHGTDVTILKKGKAYPVAAGMAKLWVDAGRGKIVKAPKADAVKGAKANDTDDAELGDKVKALVVELMELEGGKAALVKIAVDEGACANAKEAGALAKEPLAEAIAKNRLADGSEAGEEEEE